jgi:hypothetical protein
MMWLIQNEHDVVSISNMVPEEDLQQIKGGPRGKKIC